MSNSIKKLFGQTVVYGAPSIVGRLLNYFLVPLYTTIFSTSEYGLVTLLYSYVAVFNVILTYGMETAFFNFASKSENKINVFSTALSSLLFTTLMFVIITFPFASNIALFFSKSAEPQQIKWFIVILAADTLTTIPFAYLRSMNKAKNFAIIKIVNIIVNIGFNLLFLVIFPYILSNSSNTFVINIINSIYDPSIKIGYIFISNLLASVVTILLLVPVFLKLTFKVDINLLKKMLAYGWPLLFYGLAGIINETFDRIILAYIITDKTEAMSQLGIYGACYKVSIFITLFVQTFRFAAEPFFFEHAKKDREIYAVVMQLFIIICFTIFIAIMLFFDIALLFIGKDFRQGAVVIPILLVANICLGISYNLSVWFKVNQMTIKGAKISFIGAIITIATNLILIPIYGYIGAAVATLICYASIMIISYLLGQKYFPINYDLKNAAFYFILSMAILIIKYFAESNNVIANHIFSSLLFIAFCSVVFFKERRKLFVKIKKM